VLLSMTFGLAAEAAPKGTHRSGKTTVVSSAEPGALLWRNPTDITERNLHFGAGGEGHAPATTVFAFVKEDLSGTNPKYIVTDQAGVKWKMKLGAEAKPEVAASRLVWAVGYFTNEDYYLPDVQITGLPEKLHRGQKLFATDGTTHEARMQRMDKNEAKAGNWKWKDDPFVDTFEWNGLRVMMALLNNWDLKDINNKIYVEKRAKTDSGESKEIYVVSDLGGTFGTNGIVHGLNKSRGNLKAFQSSKFITKVTPQYVDFATPARPTLLELANPPQFLMRLHLRWIGKHIPRADAQRMAGILNRLSGEQIRDAFRAAGYSPQDVEAFAKVVEGRIASLEDMGAAN